MFSFFFSNCSKTLDSVQRSPLLSTGHYYREITYVHIAKLMAIRSDIVIGLSVSVRKLAN